MNISKKWIAILLTGILTIANPAMLLTSVEARADETVYTEAEEWNVDPSEAPSGNEDSPDAGDTRQEDDGSPADSVETAEEVSDDSSENEFSGDTEEDDEDSTGDSASESAVDTDGEKDDEDAAEESSAEEDFSGDGSAADGADGSAADGSDDSTADGSDDSAADGSAVSDPADLTETDGGSSEGSGEEPSEGTSGQASGAEQADFTEGTQDSDAAVVPGADAALETQDGAAEYPDITGEPGKETIVPADDCWPDIDDDDVFAGYVNREMELTGDLRLDDGGISSVKKGLSKAYASSRLTGTNRIFYDLLVEEIRKVAAGQQTGTVFSFTTEQAGVAGQYWSASELGVDAIVADGYITDEAMKALDEHFDVSFTTINRALLADCPYDLYWYDKTYGSDSSGFGYTATWDNGEYKIGYSSTYEYTFWFPVSANYSADGTEGTYEVNPAVGTSVRTARETAQSIVDTYAGYSDYEKLVAYRDEICDLTSYNYAAADNDDTPYGDPWQLIWVFDGNGNTKVVCEGYSKSYQYLCDLSSWDGLFKDCISVTGSLIDSSGSGGHMWNIVTLQGGRNYLTDITNCDNGMIGSGNGRSGLFLVGTGDTSSNVVYAQGSPEEGYYLTFSGTTIGYKYDDKTRSCFGDSILTLSEGRGDSASASPLDLAAAYEAGTAVVNLTLPDGGLVYTGNEQTPPVTVTYDGSVLAEGTDYTLIYSDGVNTDKAVNAGDALVRVTGTGYYTGTIEIPFVIGKAQQKISSRDITLTMYSTAVVSVSGNKTTLKFTSGNTSVFRVGSSDGRITTVAPGSGRLTITAQESSNYKAATLQIIVRVNPLRLSSPGGTTVTLSSTSFTYDGGAKTPAVTKVVDVNGRTMTAGRDYAVSYSNNVNAGNNTARVIIRGKGNYIGIAEKSFTIKKAAQTLNMSSSASGIAAGKTANIVVSGAKGTLSFNSGSTAVATVSKTGTSSCTVTGKSTGRVTVRVNAAATSNYLAASKSIQITILPAATSKLTAVNRKNGIKLTWAKTAGANGYYIYRDSRLIKTVTSGSAVEFTDAQATANGTKYVYTIVAKAATGKSPLSRSVTICRLPTPTFRSLKNVSVRKIEMSWNKNAKAGGYQIEYSQDAGFKGSKTVTISNPAVVSKTISWLTKYKQYNFRIRTFKKYGGAVSYSEWSPVKVVRIMK